MLWLSALAALAYAVLWLDAPHSAARSLLKTLPVAILAIAAGLSGLWGLALALALSAAGDLALSRDGDRAFLAGLSAFALAHVVYIALFLPGVGWPPVWAALPLLALAASTAVWLVPHAGGLRLPVAVYVTLITAMGLAAFGQPDALLRLGAALFILSDLLLALQMFRGVPHLGQPLWAAYWSGQALIAVALGLSAL